MNILTTSFWCNMLITPCAWRVVHLDAVVSVFFCCFDMCCLLGPWSLSSHLVHPPLFNFHYLFAVLCLFTRPLMAVLPSLSTLPRSLTSIPCTFLLLQLKWPLVISESSPFFSAAPVSGHAGVRGFIPVIYGTSPLENFYLPERKLRSDEVSTAESKTISHQLLDSDSVR